MECERPISSGEQLRALIPEPVKQIRLKILDHLERHSQHMIAMSSLAALSCVGEDGKAIVSLITTRGLIVPQGEKALRIDDPDRTLNKEWHLEDGARRSVGGLFVVAGIPETLRVNGQASECPTKSGVLIDVDEAFLQCPKAFVRSRLWDPKTWAAAPAPERSTVPTKRLTSEMRAFVDASPFGLICTENGGHGDVSPRGDPSGFFVRCLDDATLLLPDRTGNNLVDTLRNVLDTPRAMLALVVPGEADVLEVWARARLIADEALLQPSAVNGKPPRIGILLEIDEARFVRGALAGLWDSERLIAPKDFPTMGQMILDQVHPGGKTLNRIGSAIFDLANAYHRKWRLY